MSTCCCCSLCRCVLVAAVSMHNVDVLVADVDVFVVDADVFFLGANVDVFLLLVSMCSPSPMLMSPCCLM